MEDALFDDSMDEFYKFELECQKQRVARAENIVLSYAKRLDEDLSETIEDKHGPHTILECVKSYIEYMLNINTPKNISVLSLMRGYNKYCNKVCLYTDESAELIDSQEYDKLKILESFTKLTFNYNKDVMKYIRKLLVCRYKLYSTDSYENVDKLHGNYYDIYEELHIDFYKIISLLTHGKFKRGSHVNHLGNNIVKNIITNNVDEVLILKALKIISDYDLYNGHDNHFTFLLKYDGLHPRDIHRIYHEIIPGESSSICPCHRCTVNRFIELSNKYETCYEDNDKLKSKVHELRNELRGLKYDDTQTYHPNTIFEIKPKDIPELMCILYRDYKDILSNIHLMIYSGKTSEKAAFKNGRMTDIKVKYSERRPVLVKYVDKELYFESVAQAAIHFNTKETTLKKYIDEAKLYLKSCIIEYTDIPRDRFSREYDYQPLSRSITQPNKDVEKLIKESSMTKKSSHILQYGDLEKARSASRYDGPVVALDEENNREFWFKSVRMASKGLSITESKIRSYIKSGNKTSENYVIRESSLEEEHNYKYDKYLNINVRYLGNVNRYLGKMF